MFNLSQNSALRGSGHMILNVLRALNIIGLLSVAVSSWVMIVMTGMTGTFFFFDAASHFFVSCMAVFLIVSEVDLFKSYFANNWPILSHHHGMTWFGIAMIIMGCHILGNLNEEATSADNIGLPLFRLILASGILALTFGLFNIISSIIFRDGKNGITARNIRSDGSLASPQSSFEPYHAHSVHSSHDSIKQEKVSATKRWTQKLPFANGRPKISKPIPQDVETGGQEWRSERTSPIMPEVQRPPTALHPMNTGVSRYSEVSHITRF